MSTSSVTYAAGRGCALVTDTCWALVEMRPDDARAHALWQEMRDGIEPASVLQALMGSDVVSAPAFALVLAGDPGLLLVRGAAAAKVSTAAGGTQRFTSGDAKTWSETVLPPDVTAVSLNLGRAARGRAVIPTSAGVLAAAELVVEWSGTGSDGSVHPPPAPARRNPPTARPPLPSAPIRDETITYEDGEAAVDLDPPMAGGTELGSVHSTEDDEPAYVGTTDPDVVDPAEEYDRLFGSTEQRQVEDAARREVVEEDEVSPPRPADADRRAPAAKRAARDRSTPDAAPDVPDDPMAEGMIDEVPLVGGADPGPVQRPRPSPRKRAAGRPDNAATVALDLPAGEAVEERTMARPRAERTPTPPVVTDAMQATIRAVLCPDLHENPPGSAFCQSCGTAIEDQAVRLVPRPVFGELLLDDGTAITLDRPVLLGRQPSWDGEGERPHAVKLPNPHGDISRNHVLVSFDEWLVVVRDLRSTNGTFLEVPDEEAQRLRGDEPVPIEPGTRIVLSDEIGVTYQDLP